MVINGVMETSLTRESTSCLSIMMAFPTGFLDGAPGWSISHTYVIRALESGT